jgi:hypothetical protein
LNFAIMVKRGEIKGPLKLEVKNYKRPHGSAALI